MHRTDPMTSTNLMTDFIYSSYFYYTTHNAQLRPFYICKVTKCLLFFNDLFVLYPRNQIQSQNTKRNHLLCLHHCNPNKYLALTS